MWSLRRKKGQAVNASPRAKPLTHGRFDCLVPFTAHPASFKVYKHHSSSKSTMMFLNILFSKTAGFAVAKQISHRTGWQMSWTGAFGNPSLVGILSFSTRCAGASPRHGAQQRGVELPLPPVSAAQVSQLRAGTSSTQGNTGNNSRSHS